MGSTLEHGIYLPSEGEKNCYQGLASNWNKVDGALGDIAELRQLIENKFTKEIVTELPTEDINPYCIYMILKTDPETNNIYDEWVYINNAWEYLGNTKVDMTQYYTKQEVNELPAVASGVTSTKVGNYDTHIADTNIHVTASDKAKWDTLALIKHLRLVNAQVGSATTIPFSDFDDTNGIKVGDKCADLDVKVFEITAVDTANQTVTVGSALLDIAVDSGVLHKSGDETATGIKNFVDNIVAKKIVSNVSQLQINAKTNADSVAIIAGSSATDGGGIWVYGKNSSNQSHVAMQVYDTDASTFHAARLNMDGSFTPTVANNGLGSSSFKWRGFNSINPGALSLPDLTAGVDISAYITDLTGAPNINRFTPTADGWISIGLSNADFIEIYIPSYLIGGTFTKSTVNNYGQAFMPVFANKEVRISLKGTSIGWAKFYPCLGNV